MYRFIKSNDKSINCIGKFNNVINDLHHQSELYISEKDFQENQQDCWKQGHCYNRIEIIDYLEPGI